MNGSRYSRLVHQVRLLLLAALAGVALNVSAQGTTYSFGVGTGMSATVNGTQVILNPSNVGNLPVTAPSGSPSNTIITGPGCGGSCSWSTGRASTGEPQFKASSSGPVPGYPSKQVPVDVVLKPTAASAARAMAKFAMKMNYAMTTGMAIYDLAKDLGFLKGADGGMSAPTLTWTFQSPGYNYCGSTPVYTYTGGDAYSVASQAMAKWNDATCNHGEQSYSNLQCTMNADWTKATCTYINTTNWDHQNYNRSFDITGPGTAGQPVTTGPMTEDEFYNRALPKLNTDPFVPPALRDAIQDGQKVDVPAPAPSSTTGPTSVPAPQETKTTNNPDGTKTVTTTSPTVNITYGPNYYTTNVTNTTTTTTYNSNNQVTSTTTTTETKETPPESDLCKQHPDIEACAKREFDVPDGDIPKDTKNVPWNSDMLNVGWGSGCPAPINIGTFAGGARQLVFDPFCDAAQRMQPFVLAAAALSALLIVLYGVRGAS